MASVHDKERTLEREISGKVEQALPGVEVLAVELTGPERMTVYVDRAGEPVDIASASASRACSPTTCASTASMSPRRAGAPLRKPEHFRRAVGRQVKLKTDAPQGAGRDPARRRRPVPGRRAARKWPSRTRRSSGAT